MLELLIRVMIWLKVGFTVRVSDSVNSERYV